jgi:hypothetical protein
MHPHRDWWLVVLDVVAVEAAGPDVGFVLDGPAIDSLRVEHVFEYVQIGGPGHSGPALSAVMRAAVSII